MPLGSANGNAAVFRAGRYFNKIIPSGDWILKFGVWNSGGIWIDTSVWID